MMMFLLLIAAMGWNDGTVRARKNERKHSTASVGVEAAANEGGQGHDRRHRVAWECWERYAMLRSVQRGSKPFRRPSVSTRQPSSHVSSPQVSTALSRA